MAGVRGMKSNKGKVLPDSYDKALLDGLDKRSRVAKLLHERYTALANDQGGKAGLSYQRQSLIWRFVYLECWIENQERALAEGKKIDEARYLSALNSFVGLLRSLGLERRSKDIQTLDEYLSLPEEATA